ncbi:protein cholesin isoform 1-T3 [Anableps anableps]
MMGKEKSLKPNQPGGKKCSSIAAEEPMETKTKKKRKHVEVEESPVQIPCVTNPDEEMSENDKKHKKKKATREAGLELAERPASCPEGDPEKALSPEEKRVLERKLKKIRKKEEKKRLKADGRTDPKTPEPGPSASKLALEYLTCWAERRSEWKFQKIRQTWLLQHMFDSEKVSDDTFAVLLRYLDGLFGRAKETTVQKALMLVEESGRAPMDAAVQQRAQRAREVIQLFS